MPRGFKLLLSGLFVLTLLWVADKYYFRITSLYHTDPAQVDMRFRNRNFDYAMLGSSRTQCFFDTRAIDSVTGLAGYNLGLDGSEFAESYLLLNQFLKHGNRVKVLLIQTDIYQMRPLQSYSYPFHEYRYLPYLYDEDVDHVIKEKKGILKYALWKYVPFVKYAEFNSEYNLFDILSGYRNLPYDSSVHGFHSLPIVAHSDTFEDSRYTDIRIKADKFSPEENAGFYLGKIIALARQYGIEPVLIQPPVYFKIEPWARQFDIAKTAGESGVSYLDYLKTDISIHGKKFKDYTHLNGAGASEFSISIAPDIYTLINKKNKSIR